MKKITVLLGVLAFSTIGLYSCSSDDDGNNNNSNTIAGTYRLKEVNTEDATDFDLDNTPHINQMEESDCYDDARITLNADGTLTFKNDYILVDETLGTSTCASATFNGTWEIFAQTGSTIVLTATYVDDNNDENTVQLTKQGNELTYFDLFGQYPDRNDSDGAIYTNGSVEYVFRK